MLADQPKEKTYVTPKEKAKEIYLIMLPWDVELHSVNGDLLEGEVEKLAKKCTMYTVDIVIDSLRRTENLQPHPTGVWKAQEYWQQVKEEVRKLMP